ncbi:YppE family protein [Heyndrickxia vini]|uniref:YppE family protein n=1 Tax=Heyndrickxia vini TaxID=1476025 RepID=A0ABX7E651_9BACI|nr:YppE family protein [Heyndrickxia vini]QQZ11061.1 YppE family protein [Heyndrickxia vini]
MVEDRLIELTKHLITLNEAAFHSYNSVRETGVQGDFFSEVKPFADEVKQMCDEWLPLATEWIKLVQPKHLHSIQLKNTSENLQMVSVKAFYPDASLKKFKEHVRSVDYVLNRLLDELMKD